MSPAVRHVLMTADAVGGVWTYAVDLAGGLAVAGVRTTLVVLGPSPTTEARATADAVPNLSLIDTGLPLDWMVNEPAVLMGVGDRLAALAREVGADLVHLNSPALAAGARFDRPVLGVCHSDLATWWAAVRGGERAKEWRWRIDLLGRGYRACDALLAPTAAFAAETARSYGVRPAVVRNGRAAGASFWAGERKRQVLTSGRLWDAGKNVATLDATAGRLDAPVLALGALDGLSGERTSLRRAQALGRVTEEEVGRRLAESRIFCSLALYEPFGLGVLEAAQAGCALVLSDIPTFRELWDGAAMFVPATDVDRAALVLQRLLDDPAEAAALGRAAAERSRRYSVGTMTAGVLDAYAGLLQRRAAA